MAEPWQSASFTIAIALAAGTAAQALSIHLRVPGIVLLLAVGVLLGPDALSVVQPDTLGDGLLELVNFAVAIILFEGGLNLNIGRLRRESLPIRRLVTLGAVVTSLGGAVVARLLLNWSWRLSFLFGTLIIVTGPTVITPLLRRIKVVRSVSTILAAEGVFIDAIGAIVAAVALEVALSPSVDTFTTGLLQVGMRLGFGAVSGAIGGYLLAWLLRSRKLIPEGLENIVVLSFTLALFHLAHLAFHESGIAAVTVAGIVVGNSPSHTSRELHEFKEQLTIMFIGMLFVLLAADVRLNDVIGLGVPGFLTVLAALFIVRPLTVFTSTLGTAIDNKHRLFIAWIGPRGIVAAAVASLFASQMAQAGVAGGVELRALVFSVIAASVLWSGATGRLVAHLLGLERKQDAGWVILGANRLALELASLLQEGSEEIVLIESNPRACAAAEAAGMRVISGNGLKLRTLQRAEIESRAGAIGLTSNDEVNALFAQRVLRETDGLRVCAALSDWEQGVTANMLREAGAEVLFRAAVDVDRWSRRLARGQAKTDWWRLAESPPLEKIGTAANNNPPYLALALRRDGRVVPIGGDSTFQPNDEVAILVDGAHDETAEDLITGQGWQRFDRQTE